MVDWARDDDPYDLAIAVGRFLWREKWRSAQREILVDLPKIILITLISKWAVVPRLLNLDA